MARTHYHLNLNLDDPNEREAWHILQSKRHGCRLCHRVRAGITRVIPLLRAVERAVSPV